jgi:hypothetical protein
MGVVSLLGSIVITAGFALEAVVFDAEGSAHALTQDGGRVAADVGYPTILAAIAVVNAAYFAAGWLAGAAHWPSPVVTATTWVAARRARSATVQQTAPGRRDGRHVRVVAC